VSPLDNKMCLHSVSVENFDRSQSGRYITHENVTQEHYLKIVHTRIERLSYRRPLSMTYQYTITNAQYHDDDQLPSAKFTYDLSPMQALTCIDSLCLDLTPRMCVDRSVPQVVIKENARSFAHFITSVCAIIGGVFTVTGLVDSVVYHSSKTIAKKMSMGKGD
jgi:hypothetical protein